MQLGALARNEALSSDGAGLLMMVGRLLTMMEADQRLAKVVASAHTPTTSGSDIAVIEEFASITAARRQAMDAVAAQDARPAAEDVSDPRSQFIDYLAKKAGRPIRTLKRFQRISGGYSKTSIAVELQPQDEFGWGTELIVRMDVRDGPTNFTVIDEFPLLQQLHGSAVPVAQPFACESDTSVLGQPFLVSALLPGKSAASGDPSVAAWGADPEQRNAIGRQLAAALGALHSVAPPAAVRASAHAQLKSYLRHWRDLWQNLGAPHEPGLALAFDWLERNVPARIERLAWVHGDFAPYNALQDDGRLSAVIDWEFAHLGDPAEDVGYCRRYMESLLPWSEFLAAYYAAGGPEYHSESAAFYEVWSNVRNTVVLLQGRQAYVSGRNRDIKVLYAPAEFYDYFLLNALKSIRETL